MDNYANDILKMTTILERMNNNPYDDSESSDEELLESLKIGKNSSSVTNDEDTTFLIKKCTEPFIKNALICNIKKRNILNQIIEKLEANLNKIKYLQEEHYIRSINDVNRGSKIMKKRLGIPYFKDPLLFPSPPNQDFIQMQKNKEFFLLDCDGNHWTTADKNELVQAIYKDICAKRLKEIQIEISFLTDKETNDDTIFARLMELQNEKGILKDEKLTEMVAQQWQHILINSSHIFIKDKILDSADEKYLLIKVVNDSEINTINWQQISDKTFESNFTSSQCQAMWTCYLHPKLSKELWKEVENTQLQEIVNKHQYQNWDAIAAELNIEKSAYQCCVHFYSKLYDKFVRSKWTIEEEQLLKQLVEMSRIGDYINWSTIAHSFKGRTKPQIYQHYYQTMIPSLTKGPFTIEEDVLLLTLLNWQSDLKQVKLYFPNRSLPQLRDRYKTMSKDDSKEWTVKDDCGIIDHVERYGEKKWYLLDNLNRSSACIRHRYNTLKKWFEQNPNDDLESVQRRIKTGYKRKLKIRHDLLRIAVAKLLDEAKSNHTNNKKILCLNHIRKNILMKIPLYNEITKNKSNSFIYKQVSTTKKRQQADMSLHKYMLEFFQTTCKNVCRGKIFITKDDIVKKAKRITIILELLGAKLNFPNKNEIDSNIILTNFDKMVLKEIVKQKTLNENESPLDMNTSNALQYTIPPTPETVIGFRGLMLHMSTLRSHSRGIYESYIYYICKKQHFKNYSVKQIKRQRGIFLANLSPENRTIVLDERELFWHRLKMIFTWPCILQETKIEPVPESTTTPEKTNKKIGRPTKCTKLWKIELMNKKRLENKANPKQSVKSVFSDSSESDLDEDRINRMQLSKINNLTDSPSFTTKSKFAEAQVIEMNNLAATSQQISNFAASTSSYNLFHITKNSDTSIQITIKSTNVPNTLQNASSVIKTKDISQSTTAHKFDIFNNKNELKCISSDSDDELDENVKKLLEESIDNTDATLKNSIIEKMTKALAKSSNQPSSNIQTTPSHIESFNKTSITKIKAESNEIGNNREDSINQTQCNVSKKRIINNKSVNIIPSKKIKLTNINYNNV